MESATSWWVTSAILRPVLCWNIFTECCGTVESSLPGTLHSHCDGVPPMQPHGFAHCLCVHTCTVLVNV